MTKKMLHLVTNAYCAMVVVFWVAAYFHPWAWLPGAVIGSLYVVRWLVEGWRPWSPGFK